MHMVNPLDAKANSVWLLILSILCFSMFYFWVPNMPRGENIYT
jgi:hypothetical protein